MGKEPQERSSTPAKENASCVWSFINIFEFSQNYSPCKLLTDRKLGSARHPGNGYLGNTDLEQNTCEGEHVHDANDVDFRGAAKPHSYLPSVKTLMDEEMSQERISNSFDVNFKFDQKMPKNNRNYPNPVTNNSLDSVQEVLEQLLSKEPVERSNFILDLATLMIEFYSVSQHCQDIYAEKVVDLSTLSRSSSHKKNKRHDEYDSQMLHDALIVEAEVFLTRKIDDAKHLVGNGAIHSQEFRDVLEILNSNKELFLKLIQDTHSPVFKHIQELLEQPIADFSKLESGLFSEESAHLGEDKLGNSGQNRRSSSMQILQKQKLQLFSKKKDKCNGKHASKDRNSLEKMSRIVVLKPCISRIRDDSSIDCPSTSVQPNYTNKFEKYSEKIVSHFFSFREIKRKLRLMIGESKKERQFKSKVALFNRIPCGYKASDDINRMNCAENNRKIFPSKTDCVSVRTCHSSPSKSEEWQTKPEVEKARAKLQGISLASSFHEESFHKEAYKHFFEKICTDCRTVDSTTMKGMTSGSSDLDVEMLVINSLAEEDDKVDLQDEICNGELNAKVTGIVEIVEEENVEFVHTTEQNNTLSIPTAGTEDSFSVSSEQTTPNEKPRILISSASVSPSSLTINNFVSSEFFIEKPERPSPVSVLEPFFVEDDASPENPSTEFAESHTPLQSIRLDEDYAIVITTSDCSIPHRWSHSYDMETMANFVRNVLETNSFDSEMMIQENLLQSSVFDELRALSSYREDPKFFLDCANEVLLQTKDLQHDIYPCASFLKFTDLIIHEICKTIGSYLSFKLQPTLDEIMKKDMCNTMWMNLRLQVECVSAEIGYCIFEELMEETMFELFL